MNNKEIKSTINNTNNTGKKHDKVYLKPKTLMIVASTNFVRRSARRSNVKEAGFYKFKNMMVRNISKSLSEIDQKKLVRKPKKRIKGRKKERK